MHTLLHRGNVVLTVFSTVCGVLAVLTALTDFAHDARMTMPSVENGLVEIKLNEMKRFSSARSSHGKLRDQVVMTFNLQADLRNEWHWNTKQLFVFLQVEWRNKQGALNQVSVWDSIVTSKDKAFIRLKKHKTKYGLLDIGQGMRSMKYNMTLVYQVMPKIGAMRRRAVPVPMGRFPNEYTS